MFDSVSAANGPDSGEIVLREIWLKLKNAPEASKQTKTGETKFDFSVDEVSRNGRT
jgi:hypothetical protein